MAGGVRESGGKPAADHGSVPDGGGNGLSAAGGSAGRSAVQAHLGAITLSDPKRKKIGSGLVDA